MNVTNPKQGLEAWKFLRYIKRRSSEGKETQIDRIAK